MKEKTEQYDFGADTGKVLNLMINSIYTNKDIFLRELVSNASDACDKRRYLVQTDSNLQGEKYKIVISINKKNRTITIADNGIGMNRDDLIANIGTIANSGTQKFIEQLSGDSKKDSQLIGQFGVGFYASFMVADKVDVITKKVGEETAWHWSSNGQGSYTIDNADNSTKVGASVTLHLKEDMDEYLDQFRIRHIVKTYSDHISIPIEWFDEEKKESENLNDGSALWTKPKSAISDKQYKEFYKGVSNQPDDPWMILHNKNEGAIEFTNLLYIPSAKPFDLFHPDRKSRVKLYIKRVFIGDEGIDVLPSYLRFMRGIIDSEDLPLNISRETLQYNNVLLKIKKSVTKKVFSELKKKMQNDRENYESFWKNFGACLKEGLCESLDDKDQILDVCLFKSALTDKLITLDEYIGKMKDKQQKIYFLSGDKEADLKISPQLEGFIKNGIDVLLFNDTVDDFWVNVCTQYKEKEIKSVTRSGIDLEEILGIKKEDKDNKANEVPKDQENIIDLFKNTLGVKISDAKISNRLVDSPVCLTVSDSAMDIRMERFLKEQKQLNNISAKIIEINIQHPIIHKINDLIVDNQEDKAKELVEMLFDQACIIEGEPISDVGAFSKRLNNFIEQAIN